MALPLGGGPPRIAAQDEIEQLNEERPARLDELRIDTRDVELPQVDARPRVRTEPHEDREDRLPVVGDIEERHRVSFEPRTKLCTCSDRDGDEPRESVGAPLLANHT